MKTSRSNLIRFILNGTLWSFLGVVLTVAVFYWSEQRNPFKFTILLDDVQNLVEVRERIPDLKILYRNQDILELKRNIRIARITLRNDGATLLQQHYDDIESFGLRFVDATVLDVILSDSNSDYLKKHLLSEKTGSPNSQKTEEKANLPRNFIPLQKVIFEEGKQATLRVYILQDQNKPFKLEPVGKIANIDQLHITEPVSEGGGFRLSSPFVSFLVGYVGVVGGLFSLILSNSHFESKFS